MKNFVISQIPFVVKAFRVLAKLSDDFMNIIEAKGQEIATAMATLRNGIPERT